MRHSLWINLYKLPKFVKKKKWILNEEGKIALKNLSLQQITPMKKYTHKIKTCDRNTCTTGRKKTFYFHHKTFISVWQKYLFSFVYLFLFFISHTNTQGKQSFSSYILGAFGNFSVLIHIHFLMFSLSFLSYQVLPIK